MIRAARANCSSFMPDSAALMRPNKRPRSPLGTASLPIPKSASGENAQQLFAQLNGGVEILFASLTQPVNAASTTAGVMP
jgi:hypothetical protein